MYSHCPPRLQATSRKDKRVVDRPEEYLLKQVTYPLSASAFSSANANQNSTYHLDYGGEKVRLDKWKLLLNKQKLLLS